MSFATKIVIKWNIHPTNYCLITQTSLTSSSLVFYDQTKGRFSRFKIGKTNDSYTAENIGIQEKKPILLCSTDMRITFGTLWQTASLHLCWLGLRSGKFKTSSGDQQFLLAVVEVSNQGPKEGHKGLLVLYFRRLPLWKQYSYKYYLDWANQ